MAYKNVKDMTDSQITDLLLEQIQTANVIRRKELIEKCISTLDFTQEQLHETAITAPVIRAKSRIGMVLSACLKSGYITESESGILHYVGRGTQKITREEARDYVIALLEQSGPLTKTQIYLRAEHDFGTDQTPDRKDDNDLRSVLGKVILRLQEEGHILKGRSGFRLTSNRRYPNTEMGSCLRRAANGGDLKDCFLEAIHIRGGEWFEIYCVSLLNSYYHDVGKTVLSASVTGGSDDGGIDGIIKTEDWLGYRETIFMQMKNRRSVMTPKDLREFYGAVCALKGTRGVFITVSSFHIEAWKFINMVDNLTGIDGNKLFEIAKQCQKGIVLQDGKYVLDEAMFLDT